MLFVKNFLKAEYQVALVYKMKYLEINASRLTRLQ